MMVWIVVGVAVAALVGLVGYVAWRDRRRLTTADDTSASRLAQGEAERYAAERHGPQGVTWQQGNLHGP
jgi:hypothetical protein